MAEQETLATIDANKTQAAEEAIADMLFGPEETEEETDYEPGPNVAVEGEEAEPEEVQEEEQEEVEEATGFVEVEYDGQLYEVPENLKDALLRQQDYTTKTQEVATQRKEVEVQLGELEQMANSYQFAESMQGEVMKVQQFEAQAEQLHGYLRDNIDTLSSTEIEKIRFGIEDARRQKDELVQSIQGKTTEFQQAQEQAHAELLNKGTEILRQKIPGWGEEHQKEVRDYVLAKGKTDAQINNILDPVDVEIAWEAAQYRKLKDGITPAVKKVQEAPTIKPKARDPKTGKFVKQEKLQRALKSNLSASDKASLIGDDIASRMFGD
jgi:hypothetical protein